MCIQSTDTNGYNTHRSCRENTVVCVRHTSLCGMHLRFRFFHHGISRITVVDQAKQAAHK